MADEEKTEVVETDDALEAAEELSEALVENEGENIFEVEPEDDDKSADETEEKTDETTEEEKPAEETNSSEQTETPQVDDSLLERAVKAGIPMSMAKTADVADLTSHVESLEASSKDTEAEEEKPYETGLDPEKYDEGVIAEFKKVGDVIGKLQETLKEVRSENESLKGSVQQTMDQRQIEQERAGLQKFDKDIEGLGDDFKESLGEGSYAKLDKNSDAYKTRTEVLDHLASISKGYTDETRPSFEKLFNMAVYNATGKLPSEQAAVDTTPEKLAETAAKTVGKPGSSTKQNTAAGELNQLVRELDDELGH